MPWHFAHSGEHAKIANAAFCQLHAHHFFALRPQTVALRSRIHPR
jgi:hypothetical protein